MSGMQDSTWYLRAGHTMFTMCSDTLWLTVQPLTNNVGICEHDKTGPPTEEHIEIRSEDADEILSLIQEAIRKASAGEGLDLEAPMAKASSLT